MRKPITYIVLILYFNLLPVAAGATFIIRLKNGNEYVTNRYWQEGAQILFDAEGGVFGIDKMFVNKIEKTDKVIRLVTVDRRDPAQASQTEPLKETPNKQHSNHDAKNKLREPNDPIVAELNRLTAKSKEVDGMLASEIRELLNEITQFKNKLLKDSKLFIEYGREFNDLQQLGSVVETAFRSRTD
jgi:hypothetical protein